MKTWEVLVGHSNPRVEEIQGEVYIHESGALCFTETVGGRLKMAYPAGEWYLVEEKGWSGN